MPMAETFHSREVNLFWLPPKELGELRRDVKLPCHCLQYRLSLRLSGQGCQLKSVCDTHSFFPRETFKCGHPESRHQTSKVRGETRGEEECREKNLHIFPVLSMVTNRRHRSGRDFSRDYRRDEAFDVSLVQLQLTDLDIKYGWAWIWVGSL